MGFDTILRGDDVFTPQGKAGLLNPVHIGSEGPACSLVP